MDIRAQILAFCAAPLPREPIHVPEWGVDGFVSTLTADERDDFDVRRARAEREGRPAHFRATLAALCFRDESGRRVLADADIPALAAGPFKPLDRIVTVALELNRFSEDDVKALEGNSSGGPGAAS